MTTIYVWTLVLYISSHYHGGPVVIDNISSEAECQRVAKLINKDRQRIATQCIQVQKVK